MQEEKIIIWLNLLPVVAPTLLFLLFMALVKEYQPQRVILKGCEEFYGLLKERGRELPWYQRKRSWLLKKGAAFHFGGWINPTWYLSLKLVLAFCGLLIGFGFSPLCGILAFGFLYALPGWILHYLNVKDNERLLPELRLVYHALEIQVRAGVYVADALAECYGCVQERRLKQAFLELAGDIVMKADIYESLERFQGKFDNRYIDALCITMLQALESGQAVELLKDLSEQVKDMELTILERKKGALDRGVTFYQLGILAAVLGVVLYACVTQMFAAAIRL